MMKYFALAFIASVTLPSTWASKNTEIDAARKMLVGLTRTRESLASTLKNKKKEEIDLGIFKQVCVPVGKQFKTWAESQGYQARQISSKNRNPDHALQDNEKSIYAEFEMNQKLQEKIVVADIGGQSGRLYYKRIPVAESCLHCHGTLAERPAFIVEKYPNDKAYDFNVGELRGLYSVFIPDTVKRKSQKTP